MKTKRVISLLIALSMVFSLGLVNVMADGSDYVVGITVEKNTDTRISVSVDAGPTGDSAFIMATQTFILAYDTEVFYPLMKNGTTKVTGITTAPVVKNMAYELYEDPDSCAEWATKVYPYNSADGKTGFLLIQPAEGDYGSTLTEVVALAKVYLGFQAGKSYSDVKADTVRFATATELAGMSEDKAIKIHDGNKTYYWTNGGTGDTLAAGTVTASGFEFATDGPKTTPLTADMFAVADAAYTGSAITPAVTTDLTADDYDVAFANNTYVGTATATFTGKGAYEGTVEKTFAINAIAQAPVVTDKAEIVGTGSIDLATLVTGAQGDVTFAIKSGAEFATLEGATLTGKDVDGTVVVNVAVAAKDVNGDGVAEYAAYAEELVINVTTKTTFSKMAYADYEYKVENGTLYVKGADATIFVIEATYDGNKMTSCKLTPVVISGGVGSCAVSGTFFIWDANMQAMN